MARTLQEILDHQDELSKMFEDAEPTGDALDGTPWRALLQAEKARGQAEVQVRDAVAAARAEGYSWTVIGTALGVSKQAARARYGSLVAASEA